MEQIRDTLKIVSIQHELAMSTGLDLNLDVMLNHFLPVLQRRLSLASCHVYISPSIEQAGAHKGGLHYVRSPKLSYLEKTNCDLVDDVFIATKGQTSAQNYCYLPHKNQHYYSFALGKIGWLVLERLSTPIDDTILNALLPVFEKLTLSCIACMQHKDLQLEIDHREQIEQTLKRQAYLDSLTGLPNRKMLYLELRKALTFAKRNDVYGALIYFDVDRFKNINDTLGHTQGDELLVAIARKLKLILRPEDTLARVGGDEFVIMAPALGTCCDEVEIAAINLANTIIGAFEQPIQLSKNSVMATVSIGIVTFPAQLKRLDFSKKHCEQLVHNADIAMYQAKSESRNSFHFYRKSMQQRVDRHANIEQQLQQALASQQFTIFYQPLVNSQAAVVAAEALLRWNSPELGNVTPDEFIPIAEESGHIIAISEMVIDKVCQTLQQLQADQIAIDYITVNISPSQFKQANFIDYLLAKVSQYQIPASKLKLEITEGLAIEGLDDVLVKMNILIKHGFQFLLDDFGSGYSSLSYVHKLPLYAVKIDKSFIFNLAQHTEHQVIANAIIDIAERLNIGCIAEGVETDADMDYLHFKRITAYQGYKFHKPMDKLSFIQLLQSK